MTKFNIIAGVVCSILLANSIQANKCKPKYPTSLPSTSVPNYPTTTSTTTSSTTTTSSYTTSTSSYPTTTPSTSSTITYTTPSTTSPTTTTTYTTSSTLSYPTTTTPTTTTTYTTSSTISTTTTSNDTSKTTYTTTSSSSKPASYPTQVPGNNIFNGLTYSPYTVGDCLGYEKIEEQLKSISKYTNNIRLYGADCNQVENVLKAIVQNKLDIKVVLGIWLRSGKERAKSDTEAIIKALKEPSYRSIVIGITVGNEEVFNGSSCKDVCSAVSEARSQLSAGGVSGLPLSTVDVYKSWNEELVGCSDIIYANIYPYFAPKHGDGSIATSVKGLFSELNLLKTKYSISKPIVISETGWPTNGSAPVTFAPATLENQCQFLSSFQCEAKKYQFPYYVMEAYDAKWKQGNSCEQHFGIFDDSSNLKCKNFTPATC